MPVGQIAQAAAPGTYNTGDIAVINKIIAKHELNFTKAPADGSSIPKDWTWTKSYERNLATWSNASTNKRVLFLELQSVGLFEVLDVSGLDMLEMLSCGYNQLTGLKVSKNTKLEYLYCNNNYLSSLDVTKNTKLITLSCYTNQLTKLDLSKNTKMESLWCFSNFFKSRSDVKGINNIADVSYDDQTTPPELPKLLKSKSDYNIFGREWYLNTEIFDSSSIELYSGTNLFYGSKLYSDDNIRGNGDPSEGFVATKKFAFSGNLSDGVPSFFYIRIRFSNIQTGFNTADLNFRVLPGYYYDVAVYTDISDTTGRVSLSGMYPIKGYVHPGSVKINSSSKTLTVGGATTLKPTVSPTNATNKSVKWKTSNKSVATVNSKGKVTAKAPGKATITATTVVGGKKATCTVTVKPKKVTGVKAVKIKSGQAKISWKKQANVSGYQIRRATSKNGTYKSIKTTTKLTYTNKKLKARKTYYYKVRSYKTVSGKKVYGAYSDVKSVKV